MKLFKEEWASEVRLDVSEWLRECIWLRDWTEMASRKLGGL